MTGCVVKERGGWYWLRSYRGEWDRARSFGRVREGGERRYGKKKNKEGDVSDIVSE